MDPMKLFIASADAMTRENGAHDEFLLIVREYNSGTIAWREAAFRIADIISEEEDSRVCA